MNDEKMREIALFRYGIIHDFVAVSLSREEKRQLMDVKEEQKWNIPYSLKTSISKTTIWRWIRKYKESGRKIESLIPEKRIDKGQYRAIDDETGAEDGEEDRTLPKCTSKEPSSSKSTNWFIICIKSIVQQQ